MIKPLGGIFDWPGSLDRVASKSCLLAEASAIQSLFLSMSPAFQPPILGKSGPRNLYSQGGLP